MLRKHFLFTSMLRCFTATMIHFFQDSFEKEVTATFEQFNMYVLNKSINFFRNKEKGLGSVWFFNGNKLHLYGSQCSQCVYFQIFFLWNETAN